VIKQAQKVLNHSDRMIKRSYHV